MLENARILITGVTSQVALPVARELAGRNEVFGLARFRRPEDRRGTADDLGRRSGRTLDSIRLAKNVSPI